MTKIRKTREEKLAERETKRAERLKRREEQKLVRAKTGFARIGLSNKF